MSSNYRLILISFLFALTYNGYAQSPMTVSSSPTSATSVPYSGSGFPFYNPSNIVSGGSPAYAQATATLLVGKSEYLQATGFGFSIPAGSTINGIEARITRSAAGISILAYVQDGNVQLLKSGVLTGANLAGSSAWGTSATTISYGGSSSLWSSGWTASDINSASFGISFSAQITGILSLLPTANVYSMQLFVTYTPPVVLTKKIIDFNLYPKNGKIQLGWELTDITAGTECSIERSTDGSTWTTIKEMQYPDVVYTDRYDSVIDDPGQNNVLYYQMEIADGKDRQYSKVLCYQKPIGAGRLLAYPNPASGKLTVETKPNEPVKLYSLSGAELFCPLSQSDKGWILDIHSLPHGIYLVRSGGQSMPFIKQ